jgi:hypothetical protein
MPPKCPDSVAPNGNIQKTGASGYFSCVSQDPESSYTLCAANTSKDETRFDYQLEDMRIRDSALGTNVPLAIQLCRPSALINIVFRNMPAIVRAPGAGCCAAGLPR